MTSTVNRTHFDNGLTLVTEKIEGVRSLSAGIWVKTGSRNENEANAGITHFLEHMLFKGTHKRSAFQIAQSLERVGGYLNAFTANEHTCYYARCLDTQLELALDVLSDMVLNPTFPEEELEKEKKVVLEELKMYKDQPDDYLFESYVADMFKGHALGRPIIGFENTINDYNRQMLIDYMASFYQPWNITICIAGNVDHKEAEEYVNSHFGALESEEGSIDLISVPEVEKFSLDLKKDIEQTHYLIGRRSLSIADDERYKLLVANTVLGGGMSSRLHQNIREKYGYCYSISPVNQTFEDTGLYGIYAGTDREYVGHLKELIFKEFKALQEEVIAEEEFTDAKAQLKGLLLLSQENTSNRMMRLGKSELYFKRFVDLDELAQKIDEVTAEEVRDFSTTFFDASVFSDAVLSPKED